MSHKRVEGILNYFNDQAAQYCVSSGVPGYLAGVWQDGEQVITSYGMASLATGAPMLSSTGFLIGSVTKLFTSTLVLQQVERGKIDLEERVITYLPEFKLTASGAAENIRVRNLLTHTNGIDADLLFPAASGDHAIAAFLDSLAGSAGALFNPDEYISYSNGGMIVAGRLLEKVTGMSYQALLKKELYEQIGMHDSCTSPEEAILRSTAVGHFADMVAGTTKTTDMFMLPDSWAPAGSTPICTISDLLKFGQTHLNDGLAPSGKQVLSKDTINKMQMPWHDMGSPNLSPIGLGWMLMPFGSTTVLTMSGASPGGVALLAVVPKHNLVFAAFGNDGRAMGLHDQLLLWLLRNHLKIDLPNLIHEPVPDADLKPYEGVYRSNQLRVEVKVVDGQLEETMTYEPLDRIQEDIFTRFTGGAFPVPPRRFTSVGNNIFAPAGMPLETFNGYSRLLLVSYHGLHNGKMDYRCAGGRITRRQHGT